MTESIFASLAPTRRIRDGRGRCFFVVRKFKLALQDKAFLHLLAGERVADSIGFLGVGNYPQPLERERIRN